LSFVEQSVADRVRFLGQTGSGLRQSLGALLPIPKAEREDQEQMSLLDQDAEETREAAAEHDADVGGSVTQEIDALVVDVVDAAIAREDEEEEASQPQDKALRSAPSWEIGPQRYGDPSLWRPAQVEEPLPEDKEYRELYKVVREIR